MKIKLQLVATIFFAFTIQNNIAQWTQVGNYIGGEAIQDQSGSSISISSDGSIIAIGAAANDGSGNGINIGHVRVYEKNNGAWSQLGSDIDGQTDFDLLGHKLSLSDDGLTLAVSAWGNDAAGADAGQVKIFQYSGNTWGQIGSDIYGENPGDGSWGTTLNLSGDGSTLAIGNPDNDENGNNTGHVRVYENITGTWTLIGNDIQGQNDNDKLGSSVSLSHDGTTLAIGAPANDDTGNNVGSVQIYKNIGGTWTQEGSTIYGESNDNRSGSSISLSSDGSIVAINANGSSLNGAYTGQVRVFKNIGGTWTQQGLNIDGDGAGDFFGNTIELSNNGSTLAIGATQTSTSTVMGYARVFKYTGGAWTQQGSDIAGINGDGASLTVCLSGDGLNLAVGMPANDDAGADAGKVSIYDTPNTSILVSSITVQGQAGATMITTPGGSLQIIASVLPVNADDDTYTWSVSNGTGSANIDINGVLTAQTDGTVIVTATANDGSGITGSTTITISNQSVGLNEQLFNKQLKIFPNPVKSILTVESIENIDSIEIINIEGKTVKLIASNFKNINVSKLPDGLYILKVKTSSEIINKKFIKQ